MSQDFYTYSFEKLEVWQLARQLRKDIYKVSSQFPKEELFGLTSQVRRSTNSICDNLAEGSGRATNIDKAKYTNMSYTSALETINHLIGAYDLNYIDNQKYTQLRKQLDEIVNKLNALYKYQLKSEESLKERL
ncbi:four helix bundle protein [Halalkalibaculum sp. DA384]|uniref:four helix bundle protein n=1 Tax=Halalkalibaculum sp. DA384 TaxID=3373606 RepID=UPI0037553807